MSELVDTNIIIMYGKDLFKVLGNRNIVLSSIVIFEYLNHVRKQYEEYLKRKQDDRARELLKSSRQIIREINKRKIQLLHPNIDNFLEGIDLAIKRKVNIGDAVLASIAKSNNIQKALSNDNDWSRLSDYVNVENLVK